MPLQWESGYQSTPFVAELPCYEPRAAKAWPQALQHNKTEKCCTRDEIAEEHNNLEPNKRHVDCILCVGPDSSHTVFIESITAAEAFSNTHNQQFAFKWRSFFFFFVDATSSSNTNPRSVAVCRVPQCHSHLDVGFFFLNIFYWGWWCWCCRCVCWGKGGRG